jgi:hypothetical protein
MHDRRRVSKCEDGDTGARLAIPWQADHPTTFETLSVDTKRHGEDDVPESNRQPLKKRTMVLALCHNASVHELNVFVAVAYCAGQNIVL